MFKISSSGFTLVELLIVIMLISILSGIMTLSAISATDAADAAGVINDLRSLKAAAVMFYAECKGWPEGDPLPSGSGSAGASLDRYLDRALTAGSGGRYASVHVISGDSGALIGLMLTGKSAKDGVRKKLEGSSVNAGLYEDLGVFYSAGSNKIFVSMK